MDRERREILVHIGARLKSYRRRLGYSREEVGKRLGISGRTVAAYERGEREMSMDTAISFARIYQTSFSTLTDYNNILNNMILG